MHNLLSLIGMTPRNRTISRVYGREYSGACPWCGCTDAFHIWPETNNIPDVGSLGRYDCMDHNQGRNGCGRDGDMITFKQETEHLSFDEACTVLGLDAQLIRNYRRQQRGKSPIQEPVRYQRIKALAEYTETWQTTAYLFAKMAAQQLQSEPLDYLLSRGLTLETIKRAGIGYYPEYRRVKVTIWGYQLQPGEKPFTINIPQGIVIPWFDHKGAVIRLRIRRLPWDTSDDAKRVYGIDKTGEIGRYTHIYGGATAILYRIDTLDDAHRAAVFEGEIDALIAAQTDVCACVATGGTPGARSAESLLRLGLCEQVLICFDNDEAGERAAQQYWLSELNNAYRWRPLWSDANTMYQDGVDLAAWLELGFNTDELYRHEVEADILANPALCFTCLSDGPTTLAPDGLMYCAQHHPANNDTTQMNEGRSNEDHYQQFLQIAQRLASVIPGGCTLHSDPPKYTLVDRACEVSEENNAKLLKPYQRSARRIAS